METEVTDKVGLAEIWVKGLEQTNLEKDFIVITNTNLLEATSTPLIRVSGLWI